jgi:hypothetical protein
LHGFLEKYDFSPSLPYSHKESRRKVHTISHGDTKHFIITPPAAALKTKLKDKPSTSRIGNLFNLKE